MGKKLQVNTTINGKPADFLCEPRQSLLDALRDELRLTGAKEGWLGRASRCFGLTSYLEGRIVGSYVYPR